MGDANPTNPFSWIAALQKGGPWVVAVFEACVIIYLWRAYVKVRDDNEEKTELINGKILELAESSIANGTNLKNSTDANTKAVENFERRLENVEKTLQK